MRVLAAVSLVAAIQTLPAATAEPSYEASGYCGWTKTNLSVAIVASDLDDAGKWPTYVAATSQAARTWQRVLNQYAGDHPGRSDLLSLGDVRIRVSTGASADPDPDIRIVFVPANGLFADWVGLTTATECQGANAPNGTSILLSLAWRGGVLELDDVYSVAIHEIGHALGLKHIDGIGDAMSTWSYPGSGRLCLSNLDVEQAAANWNHPNHPPNASVPAPEYAKLC